MSEVVKVLVFARLDDDQLDRIRAVDPRLQVVYVGEELCIEENRVFFRVPSTEAAERVREQLVEAEVVLGFPGDFNPPYPTPNLSWVQLLGAGTNHLHESALWRSSVPVTNASGVHSTAMSEHALMCMLMLVNDAPRSLRQQKEHHWERWRRPTLSGSSVGVLGYGSIGSEVARLCAACGMSVRALDASFTGHRLNLGHANEVFAPEHLHAFLRGSDYVVNCLPLTKTTHHLLGATELAAVPAGAFVVNLSRGPIIDFEALVAALRSGHLGGAALDTTEPEPLPADSPLWDMPNVIVTCHISGIFQGYMDRLTDLFCTNLRIYLDGGPLVNLVDKARGY